MIRKKAGFTLVELLIVTGVIGVLANVVIVAISPTKQFASAYDAERGHASKEVRSAIYQHLIDTSALPGSIGNIPECTEDNKLTCAHPICKRTTSAGVCSSIGGVDLSSLPFEYIADLPVDVLISEEEKCTGYLAYSHAGRPFVFSGNLGRFGDDAPGGTCGTIICGDGSVGLLEECDDANTDPNDGCNSLCQVEDGYYCSGEPSICTPEIDVAMATYDSKRAYLWQGNYNPSGLTFKSDGTKIYVYGDDAPLWQYSLSTPWDVSTATYDNVTYSMYAEQKSVLGHTFSTDGSKMYASGPKPYGVFQYSLSTPWDISTASYNSVMFSLSPSPYPWGVQFSSDGTNMYVSSSQGTLYQYDLSTAWDLSTATDTGKRYTINTQDQNTNGFGFAQNGYQLFTLGRSTDRVYQHALTTQWDISTAAYSGNNLSIGSQESNPYDIDFNPDASKMYITGNGNKYVNQYSTNSE